MSENSPYLGLRPYQESEQDKFFGRSEEIHILTDKILAHRLTLLVAASGVGKSSLLQAGVMPALRASGMADLIYHNDWAVNPLQDLKQTIVKHFIAQQRVNADYQADFSLPLVEFLQIHTLLGSGTVVILLDQFEEFFYYQKFSQQRDEFIRQLATAIHDIDTPTAFVFSMREDFAMEMEAFKPWFAGIFNNNYRIEKLALDAARQAIVEPLKSVGFAYQPELLEELLKDLGQRERSERLDLQHIDEQFLTAPLVEPPHLQIVCQQLWLKANISSTREITVEHYQQLGTATGILKCYFDDKMVKLNREQQRLASRSFDLLVSQHGAKMSYPLTELASLLNEDSSCLQQCLDVLQAAAILRRIQRQGKPWYELYHDIFAKSIVEWNQVYKRKQLQKKILQRGSLAVLAIAALVVGNDGWQNYHQRHFRLGKETVSEQVEVYQGEFGSWDLFHQQHFVYESDYERQQIEADKRFETASIPELNNSQALQIGQLSLDTRFSEYAKAGLFAKEDTVAEAIRSSKDDDAIKGLAWQQAMIRTKTNRESLNKLFYADNLNLRKDLVAPLLTITPQTARLPKLLQLFEASEQLADSDVRNVVAQMLTYADTEIAATKLIKLLESSDIKTRNAAVNALGNIKAKVAEPNLIKLLKDNDADVRSSATTALGNIQSDIAIPTLIELLADSEAKVRSAAVYALGKMKVKTAVPKFIKLLADGDAKVRQSTVIALTNVNIEVAIPQLNLLLDDYDRQVRLATIIALDKIKNKFAVSVAKLVKAATFGMEEDVYYRDDQQLIDTAVNIVSKMKTKNSVSQLMSLLSNSNRGVQEIATRSLINIKSEAIISKLFGFLEGSNSIRRSAAVTILNGMKVKDAVPIPKLMALLDDNNADVRAAAISVLVNINFKAATPKLMVLLKDSNTRVRSAAISALGSMKVKAAIPKLIELLADNDRDVRMSAIHALTSMVAKVAIPKFIELLDDKDEYITSSVAISLNAMRSEIAIPNLLNLAKSKRQSWSQDTAIAALASMKVGASSFNSIEFVLLKNQDSYSAYISDDIKNNFIGLNMEFAIPKLNEWLEGKHFSMRLLAVQVLGDMKVKIAIPKLIVLLEDYRNDPYQYNNTKPYEVRTAAASALGIMKVKTAIPKLIEQLNKEDEPQLQQAAAEALSRMQQQPTALIHWQEQQLKQFIEKVKSESTGDVKKAIEALGFVYTPQAVTLLLRFLHTENSSIAMQALGKIGAYYPQWLQPYFLPQLIQLNKNSSFDLLKDDIKTFGQLISFSGAGKASDFKELDQAIQQTLLKIAQDPQREDYLRLAAVDALGNTNRPEIAAKLLTLLQNPNQTTLHFTITYWLAKIAYSPAKPELQKHLTELEQQKQHWREQRDAYQPEHPDNDQTFVNTDKTDRSWQDDYKIYQYAYAIARIAPDTDGINLLNHPLYQARQAAIRAIAEKATGELVAKLVQHHQAFNPQDLPSPLPYSTYQAIDKALEQLEYVGTAQDLAILKQIKGSGIETHMKEQQRAINERFDWTISELDYRLKQNHP